MSTNVHNFADSLTIGDIGTNLIQCMAGGQHFNEVTPTKSGGYEDKTLKTDLYVDDKPVQVKLDWQTMWTENACVELAQMTWMGGRMSRMRDGALLEEKLYQKDLTLMYILPGVGIAEWNPFRLNYAVWYWLTQWNHEDSFNYEGKEMKNTFNLGIGYCLVVPDEQVAVDTQLIIDGHGFKSHIIGEVVCD